MCGFTCILSAGRKIIKVKGILFFLTLVYPSIFIRAQAKAFSQPLAALLAAAPAVPVCAFRTYQPGTCLKNKHHDFCHNKTDQTASRESKYPCKHHIFHYAKINSGETLYCTGSHDRTCLCVRR